MTTLEKSMLYKAFDQLNTWQLLILTLNTKRYKRFHESVKRGMSGKFAYKQSKK